MLVMLMLPDCSESLDLTFPDLRHGWKQLQASEIAAGTIGLMQCCHCLQL